jgi:hypothetical protein
MTDLTFRKATVIVKMPWWEYPKYYETLTGSIQDGRVGFVTKDPSGKYVSASFPAECCSVETDQDQEGRPIEELLRRVKLIP